MEGTIECTLSQLEPELRSSLSDFLGSDETIITCYKTIWHMVWVQVITNLRVIILRADLIPGMLFLRKPVINSREIKSIPLSEIEKIECKKNTGYDIYTIEIIGRNQQTLEANFLTRQKAELFENSLHHSLASDQNKNKPATVERMRALSQLFQEGLITDQEYEEKKKEILSGL